MIDLKPCPFCGGEAEFERLGTPRQSTIVACTNCGCRLESSDEFNHASSWNTRPDSLTLTAAVQGEREAMRSKVHALRTEVDCRIDHGANHGGHLDYVRDALDRILKGIDVCSECDGERWHKYENPLTGEITNRTPCSTCNGDEEVPGPAPAVDVIGVVREFIEAHDEWMRRREMGTSLPSRARGDRAFGALRSLVAASPKAKVKPRSDWRCANCGEKFNIDDANAWRLKAGQLAHNCTGAGFFVAKNYARDTSEFAQEYNGSFVPFAKAEKKENA